MTNTLAATLATYGPAAFFNRMVDFPMAITPAELAEGDRVEARTSARKTVSGTVIKATDKQVRFQHTAGTAQVNAARAQARHLSLMVGRVSDYDGMEAATQAVEQGELGRALSVHAERSRAAYEANDMVEARRELVMALILGRLALGGKQERMELLTDKVTQLVTEYMSGDDVVSALNVITAKLVQASGV